MENERERIPDLYAILGVPPDATERQIALAFFALAKRYHPDLADGTERDARQFKQILAAYETLSDPERRTDYDRQRRSQWRYVRITPVPQGRELREAGEQTRAGCSPYATLGQAAPDLVAAPSIDAELPITPEEVRFGADCELVVKWPVRCARCAEQAALQSSHCPQCHGSGKVIESRTIHLRLPPGLRRGQVILMRVPELENRVLRLKVKVCACW
ncbi:MAG: hypothetical protein KatS3mg111_3657 [Pirellulaceae bacterium]|nr:MAG: hypothetical protein KatS3mg111_3657 [Pirellulaceae bacterium]